MQVSTILREFVGMTTISQVIILSLCIPLDTIPECDGQTDRQTNKISRSACIASWRAIKSDC